MTPDWLGETAVIGLILVSCGHIVLMAMDRRRARPVKGAPAGARDPETGQFARKPGAS